MSGTRDAEFITPSQAAHLLGVNREEVYGFLRAGTLPAFKTDATHWRIRRDVIEQIIETSGLHPTPTIAELRVMEEARAFLRKAFAAEPTDRELLVTVFRFGPTHDSLEESGKRFGASRERVRQIEAKVLRKLRTGIQYGRMEARDLPTGLNHLSRYLLAVTLDQLRDMRAKEARRKATG